MTALSVEAKSWSGGRWWGLVMLIFAVQVGLIFWLDHPTPGRAGPSVPSLTLKLAENASAELLALNDPTLFALPHRQGPGGLTTLGTPRTAPRLLTWSEPTNILLLAVGQPGAIFSQFIKTNEFNSMEFPLSLLTILRFPHLPPTAIAVEQSTLRLEGDLARRRFAPQLPLRSWVNLEILRNSVVRIAVDAKGRPVSPTLLSGCGSREADQYALEQARAARFEPFRRNPADTAPNPATDLTWGRMIFQWHTVPPPPTNSSEARP